MEIDVSPARRVGVLEEGETAIIDVTAGYSRVLENDDVALPGEIAEATTPSEMIPFLRRGGGLWKPLARWLSLF